MRYEGLIDTVSDIVKYYGVNILNDSKFWNILTDSYSFALDYSLRDTFKRCIAEGYVSEIVSQKGKSQKTIDKIKEIVVKEHDNTPTKDVEYVATLFSIAIAIDSCSRKDYRNFSTTPRPNPNPKPASNPNPTPKHKPQNHSKKLSLFDYVRELIIPISVGCVGILISCFFAYNVFFSDWILFISMLFCCVIQYAIINAIIKNLNSTSSFYDEAKIISIVWGLLFILIDILQMSALIPSFAQRVLSYIYTGDFNLITVLPYNDEIFYQKTSLELTSLMPDFDEFNNYGKLNFWNCVFTLCVIGVFIRLIYHICFDNAISFFVRKKRFTSLWILGLTALSCVILAIPYANKISNHTLESEQLSRDETQISFKGYIIGESYDHLKQMIDTISNSYLKDSHRYVVYIEKEQNILDAFLNIPSRTKKDEDAVQSTLNGLFYEYSDSIDGESVNCKLIEHKGLIGAIIITPHRSYSTENVSFSYYQNIKDLYYSKYNKPVIETNIATPRVFYQIGNIYLRTLNIWYFKDCRIIVNEKFIMYFSSKFYNDIIEEIDNTHIQHDIREKQRIEAEQEQQRINDSVNQENNRKEQIRQQQRHNNAINEI